MYFNKNYTKLFAFLLLLIYFFSNNLAFLFHQHRYEKVSYANASNCEKVIFYNESNSDCQHTSHITKAFEKCTFCDQHFFNDTTFDIPTLEFIPNTAIQVYYNPAIKPLIKTLYLFSNKGPPSILFF